MEKFWTLLFLITILVSSICTVYSCFYECLNSFFNLRHFEPKYSNKNSNAKRCNHDSWLYLPIPPVILSLSVQTTTIGNDHNTIFGTSSWFGFGTSSYNETIQRFFKIFKCNKNEDSVKARDQRIAIDIVLWFPSDKSTSIRPSEDLLSKFLLYSHIYLSSIACLTKSDGKVRLAILYQAKMYRKTLAAELKAWGAHKLTVI